MDIRSVTCRLAAVVLTLLLAVDVVADPPALSGVSANSSLSEGDRARIREYAEFWGGALLGSPENPTKPTDVRRIRGKLLQPTSGPGVTRVFREDYATALLPILVQVVVREGNDHTAVNAVIVMAELGSERALRSLLDHTSVRDEERVQVRLAAARGAETLIASDRLVVTNTNKYASFARSLLAAIEVENNPLVLPHLLQAMLAAAAAAPAESQAASQIRGYLVDALEGVTARVAAAAEGDDPVVNLIASFPALEALRRFYLSKLDASSQKVFGRRLGPALVAMLKVPQIRWAESHRQARTRSSTGALIHFCETFLGTIDEIVRTGEKSPNPGLGESWFEDSLPGYRQHLEEWQQVVSRPPY